MSLMTIEQQGNSICSFADVCKAFHESKVICHVGNETDKKYWCPLYRELEHFRTSVNIDVGIAELDFQLKSKLGGI